MNKKASIDRIPEKIIDAESAAYQAERANDALYHNALSLYNGLLSGIADHRTFIDNDGKEHVMIHLPADEALEKDPATDLTIDTFNTLIHELTDGNKHINILEIDSLIEASSSEIYTPPDDYAQEALNADAVQEGVDSLTQPDGYTLTAILPNSNDFKEIYDLLASLQHQFVEKVRENQIGKNAPSTATH